MSLDEAAGQFDQRDRDLLAILADVLIPAEHTAAGKRRMPSASQAGVAGRGLDQVLAARPDLADGLRDLLDKARGRAAAEFVAELPAGDAAAFGVLAEIAAGGYFMNSEVQRAVGYTGQGPQPIDPRADYMEDGLLEAVIRRGPIYRPTPAP
jgi:hypothetical protein